MIRLVAYVVCAGPCFCALKSAEWVFRNDERMAAFILLVKAGVSFDGAKRARPNVPVVRSPA